MVTVKWFSIIDERPCVVERGEKKAWQMALSWLRIGAYRHYMELIFNY